ncbi:MAG TPA: ATP-binding protein [Bradyrhizobium sp.]|nr:ATP-binding protein [Bradyrhizobium sp.]
MLTRANRTDHLEQAPGAGGDALSALRKGPPDDPAAHDTTNRKNMALLIQLRWTAVLGQIATIVFVRTWLEIELPLAAMAAVLVALVVLNLASGAWMRFHLVSNRDLLLALMLDVAALSAQLYLSGGATNPFASLYLLQVTLGAVLLDARFTWSLLALACTFFAGLTVFFRPLAVAHSSFGDFSELQLTGMFVGFALDAVLLVVFVTLINRNLRERDAHLAALRQHAAEEDHIVRMGLLASGAAHELGTPLASLSVILSDWRRMTFWTSDAELAEDLSAMEASLRQCKSIVTGILVSAGEARGEDSSTTTVGRFMAGLVAEWRQTRTADMLSFRNEFGTDLAIASDAVLKQAVFNVLDNALEVSPNWIELVATREKSALLLHINDNGPGFPAEMLSQLGKPYQSSKVRPGAGLGLFLVVNVVRKLGGLVTVQNRAQGGAAVTMTLPLSMLAIGGHHAQ